MPEMSYISSRETSTGDTEPPHFVEQRGAPHRESRSSTMRNYDNPVGFPQSSQNVFALGSRERLMRSLNATGSMLQLGECTKMKNSVRRKNHGASHDVM